MDRNYFLDMYGLDAQDLIDLNINWVDLYNILQDYKKSIDICDARLCCKCIEATSKGAFCKNEG